jgi:hypothetical protein
MGSIDLPPFVREKMKQQSHSDNSGALPPFVKKKDAEQPLDNSSNQSKDLSTAPTSSSVPQSRSPVSNQPFDFNSNLKTILPANSNSPVNAPANTPFDPATFEKQSRASVLANNPVVKDAFAPTIPQVQNDTIKQSNVAAIKKRNDSVQKIQADLATPKAGTTDAATPDEPKFNPTAFLSNDILQSGNESASFILQTNATRGIPNDPSGDAVKSILSNPDNLRQFFTTRQQDIKNNIALENQKLLSLNNEKVQQTGDQVAPNLYNPLNVKQPDLNADEIHQKISDLMAYQNQFQDAVKSYAMAQSVNDVKSGNALDIGKNVAKIMGNKSVVNSEDKGTKIAPAELFNMEKTGIEAKASNLNDIYAGNENDPEYLRQKANLVYDSNNLINKYPEYKSRQLGQIVGNVISKNLSQFQKTTGLWDKDNQKIQAGKELGLSPEELGAIDNGDIPTTHNPIFTAVNSLGNFAFNVASPIARLGTTVLSNQLDLGVSQDDISNALKKVQEGITVQTPTNDMMQQPASVVESNPNSGNYLQDVQNPNAGKYNYTASNILTGIVDGAVHFGGFVGGVKVASSAIGKALPMLTEAQAADAGMTAYVVATGYNGHYETSKQIIGDKPEDEWKRNLYALANGYIDKAVFDVLPVAEIGSAVYGGARKEAAAGFDNVLKNSTLQSIDREALSTWVDKTIKGTLNTIGETSKIGAAQVLGTSAKQVVNSILGDPEKAKEELTNNYVDEVKAGLMSLPFSMMIPLGAADVLKSRSHSNMFRQGLYDVGSKPETYSSGLSDLLSENKVTPDQVNAKMKVVNTLKDIVNSLPENSPTTGQPLNMNERVQYTYNRLKEIALKNQAENPNIKNDESLYNGYQKQIKDIQAQKEDILAGNQKENTFEPNTALVSVIAPKTQVEIDSALPTVSTPSPENVPTENAKVGVVLPETIAREQQNKIIAPNENSQTEIPVTPTETSSANEGANQTIQPTETAKAEPNRFEKATIAKEVSESLDGVNPMYRPSFEGEPKDVYESLKQVAEQANASKSESENAVKSYGQKIVDIAQREFPNQKVAPTKGISDFESSLKSESSTNENVAKPIVTDSGNLLERDTNTETVRDDANHQEYKINNKDGEQLGRISINLRNDLGGYQVENSSVSDKGKGIGKDAYISLIKSLDKPLISDNSLTPEAKGLWESLKKDGYAEFNEKEGKYFSKEPTTADNTATTKGIDTPIQSNDIKPQVKEDKGAAQTSTDAVGQGNAKVADAVLENKKEAIKVVDSKVNELQKMDGSSSELKAQKKDLTDQLSEAEDVLWGNTKNKKEVREMIVKGSIVSPFEEADLSRLKKAGFKVNDNDQIVMDVKNDGQFKFHYSSIVDVAERIRKEFPDKVQGDNKVQISRGGVKTSAHQRALDRGSLERNQMAYDIAKDNLETAKKAGNSKLAEIYSKELAKESEVLKFAKNVDWKENAASKEMVDNKEVQSFKKEADKKDGYYGEMGYYGFDVKDYMDAKKAGILGKGYSFEQIKTLLEGNREGLSNQELKSKYQKELSELEKEQQDKFGKKDGKGLKKPTTNNQRFTFNNLERRINGTESKIKILDGLDKKVNFDILDTKVGKNDPLKADKSVIKEIIQEGVDNNKNVELADIIKEAKDKGGYTDKQLEDLTTAYHELVKESGFEGEGNVSDLTSPIAKNLNKTVSEIFGKKDNYIGLKSEAELKEMTSSGENIPLGYADPKTGKIFYNEDRLNAHTTVEEVAHPFIDFIKEKNTPVYDRGIELINNPENSKYLEQVSNSEFYSKQAELAGEKGSKAYNEYLQHEALAKAIGDKGAQFITEAKRKSFSEWAKNLWESIGKKLGFKDVTAEELSNMTLDEFTSRAAKDILKGEPAKGEVKVSDAGAKEPSPIEQNIPNEEANQKPFTPIDKANITVEGKKLKSEQLTGAVKWNESVDTGISELMNERKGSESVTDVAARKVNDWVSKLTAEHSKDGKYTFNPSDTEIAQLAFYRTKINESIADIDLTDKTQGVILDRLENELHKTDFVLDKSATAAGRAFYIRQMVSRLDSENGLEVRRKLLEKKNGEPLSSEDEDSLRKNYAAEQSILKQKAEAHEAALNKDFENRVKQEVDKRMRQKDDKTTTKKKNESTDESRIRIADKIDKIADKIEKFWNNSANDATKSGIAPDIQKMVANAMRHIAEGIREGKSLPEMIKDAIGKFGGKDSVTVKSEIEKELKNSGFDSKEFLDKRDYTLDKIKEISDTEKSDTLTKSAVGKGLVNDLLNDAIDRGEKGMKVLDDIHSALKEVFPNITRENVRDAVLKEGDYKLESKNNLDKQRQSDILEVKSLAKKETDLADLKAEKERRKRNTSTKREPTDAEKSRQSEINDLESQKSKRIAEQARVSELEKELQRVKDRKDKATDDSTKKYLSDREIKLKEQIKAEKDKWADEKTVKEIKERIDSLKKDGDLNKKVRNSSDKQVDESITNARKELASEINKRGLKFENGTKEDKSVKDAVAKTHNDRVDEILKNIDDKIADDKTTTPEKDILNQAKDILERSKINTQSEFDKMDAIKSANNKLNDAWDKLQQFDELRKQVTNASKDIRQDRVDAEQQVLINRYIKQRESNIKQTNKKTEAQEFTETEPPKLNTKDARSIKLDIEEAKVNAEYERLRRKAEKNNMTRSQRIFSTLQSLYVIGLVGRISTLAKVGVSALTKQPLNTLTNLSFGKLGDKLMPLATGAKGGESTSMRVEQHRYLAHYGALGESGMRKRIEKGRIASETAENNYLDAKDKALDLKNKFGEDSKEYTNFVDGDLKKAETKLKNASLDNISNSMYEWIGGNAWQDAWGIFLHNSSRVEQLLGKADKEIWKDKTKFEKFMQIVSLSATSHQVMKNFSARAEFAAGFVARLENKAKNGVDIGDAGEILKTVNESWINFQRGQYQEDNLITGSFKGALKGIDEYAQKQRFQALKTAGSGIRSLLTFQNPIVRTPINIAKEAILEYALGIPVSAANYAKAIHSAKVTAKEAGVAQAEMKGYIKDYITNNLSTDKADFIYRTFRKGAFGAGIMMLAAAGAIKYGGFYNKDDRKRKGDELGVNEVEIGGVKLSKLQAKIFDHTSAAFPALLWSNYERVVHSQVDKGESKFDAHREAIWQDAKGMLDAIPMGKEFQNPINNLTIPLIGPVLNEVAAEYDVDANGEPIKRRAKTVLDKIKLNVGLRKYVPEATTKRKSTSGYGF